MTEYEITYLTSEFINRTWLIVQVWAGISFGLVAVSYFAAKKINVILASIITVLYSAFSFFSMTIFKLNGAVVDGYLTDLMRLAASGEKLSMGAQKILETQPGSLAVISIISVFFGTFIACIYFLWWSFLTRNKSEK